MSLNIDHFDKKILSILQKDGRISNVELAEAVHLSESACLRRVRALEEAGFINSDWTWNLKNKKISNLKKYRLSDNYLRFYLKYILPHKALITEKTFARGAITSLPNWATVMGYQFENLVISNRAALYKALQLNPQNIRIANPFFQRKTKRHRGCQIDFMIQTNHQTLYLVEIKFSQSKIKISVVEEMEEK